MKTILSRSRTALHQMEYLDPENPSLDEIAFEPHLLDLIRLRVAMIFHCPLCRDTYSTALRAAGETKARIRQLDLWRESTLYDGREKAALALAEVLAIAPAGQVPPEVVKEARARFNDAEILQLVLTIFAASDWNYENDSWDSRGMLISDRSQGRRVS